MGGMIHFPQNPPLPIHFQGGASHINRLANATSIWNPAIIEKRAAVSEISIQARWIWHFPGMDNVALHVDQIDRLVGIGVGSVQRKAGERAGRGFAPAGGSRVKLGLGIWIFSLIRE